MAEIKVPFHKAAITEEEENAVLDVLRSGWLTTGKYALEFEKLFSQAVGSTEEKPVYSLAVNSNTSGMILAMEACGVCEGSAVITTPYTFVSTATCARHLNAEVFFADIEKDSYSIDPDKIEEILKKDAEGDGYDGKGAHRKGNCACSYCGKCLQYAAHSGTCKKIQHSRPQNIRN